MNTRNAILPRVEIGNAIRTRRKRIGISQEKLAELATVHRNYIGKIERGEQNMTIDSLVRLADAFGCKPSDLLIDANL